MQYLYSFLAMDIATRRADDVFNLEFGNDGEAEYARHAATLAAGAPERPSVARRALAQGLAAVSRGSAAAARRLDSVAADDLGRSLASTD